MPGGIDSMPFAQLPEMTLRFAMPAFPRRRWSPRSRPRTSTPLPPLGTAAVPVASVPMKLPSMAVPDVPLSVTRMPLVPLPEMTFHAAVLEREAVLAADGVVDGAQADVDAVERCCGTAISCRCSRCR